MAYFNLKKISVTININDKFSLIKQKVTQMETQKNLDSQYTQAL